MDHKPEFFLLMLFGIVLVTFGLISAIVIFSLYY